MGSSLAGPDVVFVSQTPAQCLVHSGHYKFYLVVYVNKHRVATRRFYIGSIYNNLEDQTCIVEVMC